MLCLPFQRRSRLCFPFRVLQHLLRYNSFCLQISSKWEYLWKARSPDLNSLKHVWNALGRKLGINFPETLRSEKCVIGGVKLIVTGTHKLPHFQYEFTLGGTLRSSGVMYFLIIENKISNLKGGTYHCFGDKCLRRDSLEFSIYVI